MITSPKTIHTLPSDEDLDALTQFESSIRSTPGSSQDVQLTCNIPVWSSSFDDLESCSSLRKRALSTLHYLCEDLAAQGLNAKYKLVPSSHPFAAISPSSAGPTPVEEIERYLLSQRQRRASVEDAVDESADSAELRSRSASPTSSSLSSPSSSTTTVLRGSPTLILT